MTLVSIVIPCLNESGTVGQCVEAACQALRDANIDGEVLVADNGSTDGSFFIAKRAGARVVHVAAQGYGSAVRAGIEAATGRYLVIADGDGQHDLAETPRFVQRLEQGFDLVVGNRFAGTIMPGAMKWTHRYIGNPMLSGLLRLLFHCQIHDAQCGMRGLRRSAYEQMDLRTSGFELCPEMVIKAARNRLHITEIPITVDPGGREGPAHLKTVPDGWRHLMFLLMSAPNWLFIFPGTVLLGLGVAIVCLLFAGPIRLGSIPLDTRSELVGVVLSSLGFQIMSIGVFARVFSYSEPRHVTLKPLERMLSHIRLEQGLMVGGAFIAIGVSGVIFEYLRWSSNHFGVFEHDRIVIFWILWLVLGIQVSFSSLFLSMLGVGRRVWIGEET